MDTLDQVRAGALLLAVVMFPLGVFVGVIAGAAVRGRLRHRIDLLDEQLTAMETHAARLEAWLDGPRRPDSHAERPAPHLVHHRRSPGRS